MKNGQYFAKHGYQQGSKEDFIEYTELWFKNNIFHRTDGPAKIFPNGALSWMINGIWINYEVETWIKENNYPEWENEESWNDLIKLHFKLTFCNN